MLNQCSRSAARALRLRRLYSEVVPTSQGVPDGGAAAPKIVSEAWKYPGVEALPVEHSEDTLYMREHGIYESYQVVDTGTTEPTKVMLKDPMPDWLHSFSSSKPGDDEEAEKLMLKEETGENTWLLAAIEDTESHETALGEQLLTRTTDLDKTSCDYYPVGYGLPPNTLALVAERETGRRYYHLCGGRSDHVTYVEGDCYVMKADIELFMHVLNYFGECWGIPRKYERYHHKYRGLCVWGRGIDMEDAEFLDGFFGSVKMNVAVDLERLDEGCEGYVPVVYCDRGGTPVGWGDSGILMWQNFLFSPVQNRTSPTWWRDLGTLRPLQNLVSRTLSGKGKDPTTVSDLERHAAVWGLRGEVVETKRKEATSHIESQEMPRPWTGAKPLQATREEPPSRANIHNHFGHGFYHPMFTTDSTSSA